MTAIVELEVVLARLGVDPSAPEADTVARLLDAVSTSIRRRTRRGFEGAEGAAYDETYRLNVDPDAPRRPAWGRYFSTGGGYAGGETQLVLRHFPVASVTSIARARFDGTVESPVLSTALWRLEDPERGLILLRTWAEYVRVMSRVTGDIPDDVQMAAEEWVADRWATVGNEGLTSYTTGADSESYATALVGQPPRETARVIASYYRSAIGGVV